MGRLVICSRHHILFECSNGEERDVQSIWHVLEKVEVYRGLCDKIE
jgi:hypothetical protein